MDKVKIDLKNCYGIKALKYEFDFSKQLAFAVYAPNGSMKSSLAKTFEDAATGGQPSDRFFPARPTTWSIVDEKGGAITGARILVFGPIDEKIGPSAKTSTLLVNAALRTQYEKLHGDIDAAKAALIAALKKQGGTKSDIESDISMAYMRRPNEFETAMGRIQPEIQKNSDAPFASVQYDKIFNDQVLKAITSEDLAGLIAAYTAQYNSLLEKSVFSKKERSTITTQAK